MGLNRRFFMQVSAYAGGGMLLGLSLGSCVSLKAGDKSKFRPNAWLRVSSEGPVTFILDKTEMGQGVYTGLATIIAEELEINPEDLVIEMAPADRIYGNPQTGGLQMTGGSSSISTSYFSLRQAGAAARTMLVLAAAQRWKVGVASCEAREGAVHHPSSGQMLSYGELAQEAALLKVPEEPQLKDPKDFKRIGRAGSRLDAQLKVTGQAQYGIDVELPNLLTAVFIRSPRQGARVKSWDGTAARAMRGVEDIVAFDEGVAVVARSYWQARRAGEKLVIAWEEGFDFASPALFEAMRQTSEEKLADLWDGSEAKKVSPPLPALAAAYWAPYAAHVTMEPMNCTVQIKGSRCEIWAPTQAPGLAQQAARDITGFDYANIKVHTTFIGGGFGRRLVQDYVAQAVRIALKVQKPIKLIWSREEDMQHDFYRPASYHGVKATLDDKGRISSWLHTIVGPSILSESIGSWVPALLPNWVPEFIKGAAGGAAGGLLRMSGADPTSSEGASNMPYEIAEREVKFVRQDPGLPVGFWRSVGHSYTGFVVESALDELARLAGEDPALFRMKHLESSPRHRRVLEELVQFSLWKDAPRPGIARGLALHASFGSICGQVAELRVEGNEIKVEKVYCVIDCGQVINPEIVRDQMIGSINFGLTAALMSEITLKDGAVEQSNFHDHPVLRLHESPEVLVHIVQSSEHPSGVGEPGVPPVAAAVANAVFAATGQRLRQLPLRLAQV